MQQHIDLEDGALIGRVRLVGHAEQLRQHVQAKVDQQESRFDCLRPAVEFEFDGPLSREVEAAEIDAR